MAEQLDQNVVALMKAIRTQESGNKAVLPQEKGIGGASIYQYTTGTWKGVAQKYLGDANAPLNRANENKATYFRIKEWKDKGYKPAQIASMWNAGEGEPNAYKGTFGSTTGTHKAGDPSEGINSYGVKYSVPNHARNVIANYKKEIAKLAPVKVDTPVETTAAPAQSTVDNGITALDVAKQYPGALAETVKGAGVGAAKYAGTLLAGAASLGEKYLLNPIDRLMGKEIPQKTVGQEIQEKLKPTTTAEKVGFTAAEIGSFLLPGGASVKAGKAVSDVVKGGKLLKGAAKLATTAGTEAGIFGGQTALKEGEITPEAMKQAAIAAAFPIAGRVLAGTAKVTGEAVAQILGKTTGAGEFAIKEAISNPNVIKFAREAGAEGAEGLQKKAVEEAKNALELIKQKRATTYKNQLEKIKLNPTEQDNLVSSLRKEAIDLASPQKYDISIVADETGKQLNILNFDKSVITESQLPVQKAYQDILSWADNTASGLDTLKKRLGDYISQTKYGTPSRSLLSNLRNTLDNGLKKNVNGYEKMTSGYREASELIDDIESALSLGSKAQTDTAVRKLMSTMRQNNEFRKDLLEVLSQIGKNDIMGKIAGSTLASVAPRGVAGALFPYAGASGVAFSVLNPSTWPLAIVYLGASSPRLVGEFMNIVGKANRLTTGALESSPQIIKQLQRIFGDAEQELGKGKTIFPKAQEKLKNLPVGLSIKSLPKIQALEEAIQQATIQVRNAEQSGIKQRITTAQKRLDSLRETLSKERMNQ